MIPYKIRVNAINIIVTWFWYFVKTKEALHQSNFQCSKTLKCTCICICFWHNFTNVRYVLLLCKSIFGDMDFTAITEHWISSRIEQLSHSHIGISCYRLFRAKQTYFLWIIHAFKAQSIVWWVFLNESLWNRHITYNIQHFVKRGVWQCTPLDLLSRSGQKVHVSWS